MSIFLLAVTVLASLTKFGTSIASPFTIREFLVDLTAVEPFLTLERTALLFALTFVRALLLTLGDRA